MASGILNQYSTLLSFKKYAIITAGYEQFIGHIISQNSEYIVLKPEGPHKPMYIAWNCIKWIKPFEYCESNCSNRVSLFSRLCQTIRKVYLAAKRVISGPHTHKLNFKSIIPQAIIATIVYLMVNYWYFDNTGIAELTVGGVIFFIVFYAINLLMQHVSSKKNEDMLKD
jgi:hypothetical protein